jgi:hypothetical protein
LICCLQFVQELLLLVMAVVVVVAAAVALVFVKTMQMLEKHS